MIADKSANIYFAGGEVISGARKDFDNYTFEHDGKKTQIVFLTKTKHMGRSLLSRHRSFLKNVWMMQ